MDNNQPIVEPTPAPVAPVAPVAQAAPVAPVAPAPAPVSDRAGQEFQKLLESNQRLFQTVETMRQEMERVKAAPAAPAYQAPAPQVVDTREFIEVDPTTGEQFINDQKLQSRIKEINDRATRAEQAITQFAQQNEQREIQRQEMEAYAAYPELNPANPGYNPVFAKQTRAYLQDSFINQADYGNRMLQFKEAADLVRQQFAPQQAQPVQEATPNAQAAEAQAQAEALRQQAIAEPIGQPAQQIRPAVANEEYYEQVRTATRKGDDNALAARLASLEETASAVETPKDRQY